MKFKLLRLASYLPNKFLVFMAKHFDGTLEEFMLSEKSFWMDADYWQYARKDKRKHPLRYAEMDDSL
jgi:hypothetical protein